MADKTLSAVAQRYLGSSLDVDKLMDFNPSSIPFEFPPQVDAGLKLAREAADVFGLNIKVPDKQQLIQMATGEISKVIGRLGEQGQLLNKAKGILQNVSDLGTVLKGTNVLSDNLEQEVDNILQRIDWLL
jgi:hypothetical protein